MTAPGKRTAPEPAQRVRVRVPASTSNLGPGFDCLGLALALHNSFTLEPADQVSIAIRNRTGDEHGQPDSTDGRHNLVWRSADEVFRRVGAKIKGLKISMDLAAPMARGLGSSATAIIAGVAGANALLGAPLSDEEVFRLIVALEGHPDNVSASFMGGLTVSMMNRRNPHVIKHRVTSGVRAVVAMPPYPISTEKARAALPGEVPHSDAVYNLTRTPFVIRALTKGPIDDLMWAMDDRLHEPYRIALSRNGRSIRKSALAAGAAAVAISGAGPSLVAFCRTDQTDAVAEAMRQQLKGGRVDTLKPDNHGVRITVNK